MKFLLSLILLSQTFNVESNLNDNLPDDLAFSQAITQAINGEEGSTVYIGKGTLILSKYAPEFRQLGADLNKIKVIGEGPDLTTIKGVSDKGFDVIQLNGIKNISFSNFSIESIRNLNTGEINGTNGISMTNGVSNVKIKNVRVKNLPFVIKENPTFYNGGKGITIQTGKGANTENIEIEDCEIIHCPFGIGIDCTPKIAKIKNIQIRNNKIRDCLIGFGPSFTEVDSEFECQFVDNQIIDCDRFISNSRACNVQYIRNILQSSKLSGFIDIFANPHNPIIFYGSNDCLFIDNYIQYRPECESVILFIKTPKSCQRNILARNTTLANSKYAYSDQTDGIISSLFSKNIDLNCEIKYKDSLYIDNEIEE